MTGPPSVDGKSSLGKQVWVSKAPHVRFDAAEQKMVCENCGGEYKPALPMPLAMFAASCKEWVRIHRRCKPRTEVKP